MSKKILFLLSAILLLASCSTIHLAKKLYSDGYYVSANKKANNHQETTKNHSLLKPDYSKSAINNKGNNSLETASINPTTPLPATKSYSFIPKTLNNQKLLSNGRTSLILKNKTNEKVAVFISKMEAKSSVSITKKQNIKGAKQTQDGGKTLGLISFVLGIASLGLDLSLMWIVLIVGSYSAITIILPLISIILGTIGLFIGIRGLKTIINSSDKSGLGFAIAGLALCAVGAIYGLIQLFDGTIFALPGM